MLPRCAEVCRAAGSPRAPLGEGLSSAHRPRGRGPCWSPGGVKQGCAGLRLPGDPFGEVKREERESERCQTAHVPARSPASLRRAPGRRQTSAKALAASGLRCLQIALRRGGRNGWFPPLHPPQEGRREQAAACDRRWRQTGNSNFPFGSGLIEHLRVTSQQKQL